MKTPKQNFSNLLEIIEHINQSCQNSTALNFIQDGQWVNISTTEFVDKIKNLSLALKEIGLEKGDGFSTASYPNPIWLMMDFAAIAAGAVSVPIFPNISSENLLFEINDAKIEFMFCDNLDNLHAIQNSNKKFKKIIIDGFECNGNSDDNIIKFSELLAMGEQIEKQEGKHTYQKLIKNIKQDDLATIIYTSGSTGRPKGVRLTHQNLILQIQAIRQRFDLDTKRDVAVSFLPLAHIFERVVVSYYIACGVSIYFIDNINNIGKIVKEIRPTIMTVVPRLLEKIYNVMKSNVDDSSFLKKTIGNKAFKFALQHNPDNNFPSLRLRILKKLYNLLVYKKLQAALGGRFRFMICGSAPLSLEIEKFFKNIGIYLFIGYGLTESTAVISANYPGFNKLNTVGKVFPSVSVKLEADKELLAKSATIMQGYHNNPQKTKEAIDKNGWLRTGDLATIDSEGYIKIIGRKKELFKTSGGEYVSPVPIEQKLLAGCEFLAGACIIAEGRKFVSCLLFVDFEILEKYKNRVNMDSLSNEDFLSGELVGDKIAKLVNDVNDSLNSWEQIKKYYLSTKSISIETGELTPSMKLCRAVVENKYKQKIAEFY